MDIDLQRHGAHRIDGLCEVPDLAALEVLFSSPSHGMPGRRLPISEIADLRPVQKATQVVRTYIGGGARPVRAIAFDKSLNVNWSLGWHQDRTVEVAQRIDVSGFENWTIKAGMHHVSPPISILKNMLTVRLHLDAVDDENAPLLIAPGSHRFGIVAVDQVPDVVEKCGERACHAKAGTFWVYSTPILHASSRSKSTQRRRVLQIDYSANDLPDGLEWAADVDKGGGAIDH